MNLLPFERASASVPVQPFCQKVAPAQSPIRVVLMLRCKAEHVLVAASSLQLPRTQTYINICSSSKNVSVSHLSLPKLALGVPKVDMSGAPAVMLEGTSPAIQNQICQGSMCFSKHRLYLAERGRYLP